jgi:predicted Zn-dependent protease
MKKFLPLLPILSILFFTSLSAKQASNQKFDKRLLVIRAMSEEMDRSMKKLIMPDFEKMYFLAYELKDIKSTHIQARFGAIYQSSENQNRKLRVETRVGSYEFDNIGSKKNSYDFSFDPGYHVNTKAPVDNDPSAIRNALWLLTDISYKKALKAYLKRKSSAVTEIEDKKSINSFTKELPSDHIDQPLNNHWDHSRWEQIARSASAIFEDHPEIFDSYVNVNSTKEVRYYVTNEKTRIITERTLYHINVYGATRAEDGMLLTAQKTIYGLDPAKLPSKDDLFKAVETMIANLKALRNAPLLEPYTGPAILDGDATGVLFHEVIGHRLEGERQLDEEEGKTFKGQIGRKIIPEFLSVIDDPTTRQINGTELNGYYLYDDEGVFAQKVVLVKEGKLESFLTSRTPIEGFVKSNGHGRSAAGEKPRARMANTIIQSNKTVPMKQLKEMLIKEVKKQKKPYGLIIKNIVGGSTHTSTWGYQAYKGIPELVYRVYPDGREELVRGVEIVGTPIASINKIIATSDQTAIFNGFCGAESGYVPVSAVAPDVLMTEIELQRSRKKSAKPPILPSPWTGPMNVQK